MSLHLYINNIDEYKVSDIAENGNFKTPGNSFLSKKNPFSYDENIIRFEKGAAFDFYDGENWNQISNRDIVDFDPLLNLDTGSSYKVGTDYFIYLCLSGSNLTIVVSENATFPNGFNANNSRKIGGFHYGVIRKVTPEGGLWVPVDSNGVKFGATGIKWQDNVTTGIIPNSLWDLKNKPQTLFGGMVKVGHLWMSIYEASVKETINYFNGMNGSHVTSGKLQSCYGRLPVTGAEGMSQLTFNELAHFSGMRLPFASEWLAAAYGSPQGSATNNNYGWTQSGLNSRTYTGNKVNPDTGQYDVVAGVKPFAVSAYNVVDCVGNVYEWLADYSNRNDVSWSFISLGNEAGNSYIPNSTGLVAYRASSPFGSGTNSGSRSLAISGFLADVSISTGVRLACDAAA